MFRRNYDEKEQKQRKRYASNNISLVHRITTIRKFIKEILMLTVSKKQCVIIMTFFVGGVCKFHLRSGSF